jgi:hypothetical protein
MTPADVLLKAADRVQFGGWTQYTFAQDAAGRCVGATDPNAVKWCARGAIKAERLAPYRFAQAVTVMEDYLNRDEREPWSLMTWNDQPGRTAGEVADTMRRVAKELSNEARP